MRLIVLLALALPGCAATARPVVTPIPAQAQTSTAVIQQAVIKPLTYPAQNSVRVIPPEEYDHPFNGVVKLTRSSSQDYIKANCPASIFPYHLGCAGRRADGSCAILMADDETIRVAGFTPEIVLRHEEAHCNGWPADHRGAR